MWLNLSSCFSANRVKELQFKINHGQHNATVGHNKINSDLSRLFVYIRHDLKDVLKEINDINGQTLTVSHHAFLV